MIRRLVLVFAVLGLLALPSGAGVAADVGRTVISGGDLPHAVRLSAVDEDAFVRRINLPAKLEVEPDPSGVSYTVTSAYWDAAVRNNRKDRPLVEADATYYPEGGYVLTRQGDRDVWITVDLRQQAVLNRYVRLTNAGLLSEQPGIFDMLRAAAAQGEAIGIQVGDRPLTEAGASRFWEVAQPLRLRPESSPNPSVASPAQAASSVWIVFTLTEGRSVQFLYSVVAGVLVDALGSEVYPVPARWLTPVLGADAAPRPDAPLGVGPTQIAQERGAGSPVWWLVMAGVGLVCIGAALWLRRRLDRTVLRSVNEDS